MSGGEAIKYSGDDARQTIKYSGELVLVDLLTPAMIVRDGGRLERWDGVEGRRTTALGGGR